VLVEEPPLQFAAEYKTGDRTNGFTSPYIFRLFHSFIQLDFFFQTTPRPESEGFGESWTCDLESIVKPNCVILFWLDGRSGE
jgi:hypothetical protein